MKKILLLLFLSFSLVSCLTLLDVAEDQGSIENMFFGVWQNSENMDEHLVFHSNHTASFSKLATIYRTTNFELRRKNTSLYFSDLGGHLYEFEFIDFQTLVIKGFAEDGYDAKYLKLK